MGEEVGVGGVALGQEISATLHGSLTSSAAAGGGRTETFTDSTQTQWTDEKHSLYLNSIEASFINELYGSDYHVQNSFGLLPTVQKQWNSSALKTCNRYSGQFKVQRRGRWETFEYGRENSRIKKKNELLVVPRNPWIQHFKANSANKDLTNDQLATGAEPDLAICSRRQVVKATFSEAAYVSKRLPRCVEMYNEEYGDNSAEVSDQNFIDDDPKLTKKISRAHCKKRTRNTGKTSGDDQAVPHKIYSILPSNDASAPCETKDAEAMGWQTEDLNVSMG